jgi:hypothetical protein
VSTGWPIPADEVTVAKRRVRDVVVRLRRFIPQLQRGVPAVPGDPAAMLRGVWSPSHRAAWDHPPRLADALRDGLDLGRLMVDGPFVQYLRRDAEGLCLDLRALDAYAHRGEVRRLAARVAFAQDPSTLRLTATAIALPAEQRVVTPEQPEWFQACRLVASGLFMHTVVVRHFGWTHAAAAGAFAVAVRATLPARHPLKALLWPHVHGTLDVNNTLGPGLVQPTPGQGVFGDIFNLTHDGVLALLRDEVAAFDLRRIDPRVDADARGLSGVALPAGTWDDAVALFDVLSAHARRWCALTWADDAAVAADAPALAFLAALDATIPGGLRGLVARRDAPTRDEVAAVCALHIHNACVVHELVGNLLWNYVTWPHLIACRVYPDDRLPPADVHQRFFNVLFATNVPNRPLRSDWRHVAPSPAYAELLDAMQSDLGALQSRMAAEPWSAARLYPDDLEAAVAV